MLMSDHLLNWRKLVSFSRFSNKCVAKAVHNAASAVIIEIRDLKSLTNIMEEVGNLVEVSKFRKKRIVSREPLYVVHKSKIKQMK